MELFFKDFYDRLSHLHHELADVIEGLPTEALDFKPHPEANSLAVLITHVAGSERYWIGEVAGGDPAYRVRDQEFTTEGRTAEELQQMLNQTLSHSRMALSAMRLSELDDGRLSPVHGESFTLAWVLLHSLEHTAQHLGHAQVGRQVWEAIQ